MRHSNNNDDDDDGDDFYNKMTNTIYYAPVPFDWNVVHAF